MPFLSTDKRKIVRILQLDRSQLARQSRLQQLMDELEEFDTNEGTTQVLEIQNLIAQFNTADNNLTAASSTAGILSFDADNDSDVTYSSAGAAIIAENDSYLSIIAEIEAILDPYGYLDKYKSFGRAIAT